MLARLLGAVRDRHGAEQSVMTGRANDAVEDTWNWEFQDEGHRRRRLRVMSHWRYNPTGLGAPNVIKLLFHNFMIGGD